MCQSCTPETVAACPALKRDWKHLLSEHVSTTLRDGAFLWSSGAAKVSLVRAPYIDGIGKQAVQLAIRDTNHPATGVYYKSEIRELIDFLTVVEQHMN